MAHVLQVLFGAAPADARALMAQLDSDSDGRISFAEFAAGVAQGSSALAASQLRSVGAEEERLLPPSPAMRRAGEAPGQHDGMQARRYEATVLPNLADKGSEVLADLALLAQRHDQLHQMASVLDERLAAVASGASPFDAAIRQSLTQLHSSCTRLYEEDLLWIHRVRARRLVTGQQAVRSQCEALMASVQALAARVQAALRRVDALSKARPRAVRI